MQETLDVAAFKHVVVPIGVVIGLGVARMVNALSHYIQHRERVRFEPAHAIWSAVLFLWFVGLWWIAWELRRVDVELWSFFTLIFLLAGPCLLYLAATLLMPDLPDEGELDLGARLETNGRAFFGALIGVLLWLAWSEIWLLRDPWIVLPKRIFQGSAILLFCVGALFPTRRMARVLGALTLPLIVVAFATIRSKLG